MDVTETRRINLIAIIERSQKKKAALSEQIGVSASYLSQITSTKNPANIGSQMARKIEDSFELPHGWMDTHHDESDVEFEEQLKEFKDLQSQLDPDELEHLNELMRLMIEKRKVLKKLL